LLPWFFSSLASFVGEALRPAIRTFSGSPLPVVPVVLVAFSGIDNLFSCILSPVPVGWLQPLLSSLNGIVSVDTTPSSYYQIS